MPELWPAQALGVRGVAALPEHQKKAFGPKVKVHYHAIA
jgi:hypothetical protein